MNSEEARSIDYLLARIKFAINHGVSVGDLKNILKFAVECYESEYKKYKIMEVDGAQKDYRHKVKVEGKDVVMCSLPDFCAWSLCFVRVPRPDTGACCAYFNKGRCVDGNQCGDMICRMEID